MRISRLLWGLVDLMQQNFFYFDSLWHLEGLLLCAVLFLEDLLSWIWGGYCITDYTFILRPYLDIEEILDHFKLSDVEAANLYCVEFVLLFKALFSCLIIYFIHVPFQCTGFHLNTFFFEWLSTYFIYCIPGSTCL